MEFSFKMLRPSFQHKGSQNVEVEVAGAFDAFISLEEIESGLDWMEVLAASWGVPHATSEEKEQKPSRSPNSISSALLNCQNLPLRFF